MSLFGTSGVRGVFNEDLTLELCYGVAQSLGTVLPSGGRVCVATDTRVSGPVIRDTVISALTSCGVEAADLGILPTPALALLTREWGFDSGVMITASHNPPEFNGIKLFNHDSLGYSLSQEEEIETVYFGKNFRQGRGTSYRIERDALVGYLNAIRQKLPHRTLSRRWRVVVDPGNGAASGFASRVMKELGVEVIPLNDSPDGRFPGRNPEPKEDTLEGTINYLRECDGDLAVCFDGDADRVVFCDREGFIGFNEGIAYLSRLAVQESGRKVVASTVESGLLLELALQDLGAGVIRGKVGDVHVAHLARDNGAAIGVEQVGVYVFPDVGYYPDSIFASILLLDSLNDPAEIRDFFHSLPRLFFRKNKIHCPNSLKTLVMGRLAAMAGSFGAEEVNDLDGLRMEFGESWMLIRASGTEPAIRVLAESTSESEVTRMLATGVQVVESLVSEVSR